MLDYDLAQIYEYETTTFNQQVKNKIKKFEGDDFMFQLTNEEFKKLMSKNRYQVGEATEFERVLYINRRKRGESPCIFLLKILFTNFKKNFKKLVDTKTPLLYRL